MNANYSRQRQRTQPQQQSFLPPIQSFINPNAQQGPLFQTSTGAFVQSDQGNFLPQLPSTTNDLMNMEAQRRKAASLRRRGQPFILPQSQPAYQ